MPDHTPMTDAELTCAIQALCDTALWAGADGALVDRIQQELCAVIAAGVFRPEGDTSRA